MPLYLSTKQLATTDQAASAAQTAEMSEDLMRQKAEAEQAANQPQYTLPSLGALGVGGQSPVMQAIGALPSMGQQAMQTAKDTLTWALPDLAALGVSQPEPTPSGTPSAMPSAGTPPSTVPATITSGPRPGQTLRPGESVGSITITGGSNPEKQAEVYRQARANGLDDEGARILVAVTETEGGLEGAVGDTHLNPRGSRGPFQFYEGGQMPAFRNWLQQQGIQGDPDVLVNDIALATRYAATTYLGRAIAAGRERGLVGADLATYVQRHGQVSDHPERTGANYNRLYGPGAQTYPERASSPPAQPQNIPPAPLTPPQTSDVRTYSEPAPQSSAPIPYKPQAGQRLRVVDQWGNETVYTEEELRQRPGGTAGLTILGPVAMNAGSAPPPAEPAPAAAGASSPTSGGSDTQAMWSPDEMPQQQGGAFQAATGRSGGSGVMYRGPLGAAPAEVGNDGPQTSTYNDPDAGGTITQPLPPQEPTYQDPDTLSYPSTETGISGPLNTSQTPENPSTEYVPQIVDGRTVPPTPGGNWQPVTTVPRPGQADPATFLAEDSQSQAPQTASTQPPSVAQNIGSTLVEAGRAGVDAFVDSATRLPTVPEALTTPFPDPVVGHAVRASQAAQGAASDVIGRRLFQGVGGNPDEEIIELNIPGVGPVKLTKGDAAGLLMQMGLDPANMVGGANAPKIARAAAPVVAEGARVATRTAGRVGRELAEEGARQLMDLTPSPRVMQAGEGGEAARRVERLTVEQIQDRIDRVTELRGRARAAGDQQLDDDAGNVLAQLQSDLVDARNARMDLEPRITSDVGRPIRNASDLGPESADAAMDARYPQERVAGSPDELSGPVSVPTNMAGRMNSAAPAALGAGAGAELDENGEPVGVDPLRAAGGMAVAGLLGTGQLKRAGARWQQATAKAAAQTAAAKAAGQAPPPTAGDWLRSIGYSGMIGPSTGIVNAVGNGMELLYHIPKDLMRSAVRGNMREAGEEAKGLVTGFMRAGGEMLDALAGAHPGGGVETARLSQRVDNRFGQAFANLLEAPTRVFSELPDAFYRSIATSMGESRAAAQIATGEGLKGSAWSQRVSQLLQEVEQHKTGQLTMFPQQVDQIMKDADTLAQRLTLRGDIGPRGQKFKDMLDALPFGLGHIVVPFFNTPYQMLQRQLERSVVGLKMGTQTNKFDKHYDVLLGSGVAAGAAALGLSGAITGSGPTDFQQRRQLQAQGWQPKSTLVGGVWVPNNAFGVFGPMLDTAGELGDALRYQKKDATGRDFGGELVRRAGSVVTNQVYLRGFADLIKAVQDAGSSVESYGAQNAGRLIPGGATARMIGNMTDPNERAVDSGKDVGSIEAVRQRVARGLPGQGLPVVGGREGLPVAQDVLGRSLENERQGAAAFGPKMRTPKPDPLIQAFEGAEVKIGEPPDKIQGVTLTPNQKRQYQRVAGRELQRLAGPIVSGPNWATMPLVAKQQILNAFKQTAQTLAETSVRVDGGSKFVQDSVKVQTDKALGR